MFDHYAMHKTYFDPAMTRPRRSIEFRASNAEQWLKVCGPADRIIVTRSARGLGYSYSYLDSCSPQQSIRERSVQFEPVVFSHAESELLADEKVQAIASGRLNSHKGLAARAQARFETALRLRAEGVLDRAMKYSEAALSLADQASRSDPADRAAKFWLGRAHALTGDFFVTGEPEVAKRHYQAADSIMDGWPLDREHLLVRANEKCRIADFFKDHGDIESAMAHLGAALSCAAQLNGLTTNDDASQFMLARIYTLFGDVLAAQDDLKASSLHYASADCILERQADPDQDWRKLREQVLSKGADVLLKASSRAKERGDPDRTIAHLRNALSYGAELHWLAPNDDAYLVIFARTYAALSEALAAQGDWSARRFKHLHHALRAPSLPTGYPRALLLATRPYRVIRRSIQLLSLDLQLRRLAHRSQDG
jgi:tetratricopeptide (TPR) repeat protein